MEKERSRPDVVAIFVGVIIGAICGTLVGWILGRWEPAVIAGVAFAVVWFIIQHVWWGRTEKKVRDRYEGR